MKLETLMLREGTVRLAKPITLLVEQAPDGMWNVSSRELSAFGVGRTIPAAVEDLCETFWWVYTGLQRTPQDRLTPPAVTFLSSVGEFVSSSAAA